ncbi:MAG TPA: DUF2867 domain-containing protein [Mycobacteriales bacterium]|nr:DUF2867 domain-containing protein [Mycobacteriales bacterium]
MTRARATAAHDPGVLARPDYLDAIRYAGRSRTAEEWARATFEGAPKPVPAVLRLGWRRGLGLRLGPYPATGHVLGWPVFESAPDRMVLGVESAVLGHCRLVFQTDPDGLLLTTVIRYGHRVSRPVWTVVAPVHRLITRLLVTRAGHARSPRG